MTDQRDWHWYYARNEEGSYNGPHPTREDAIAEGRGDYGEDDRDGFWVAEATNPPVKLSEWIHAGDPLEDAEDAIFDSDRASAEWDDVIFEASEEQQADLKARIIAACDEWQEAHGLTFQCSTFEAMRNVEHIPGAAARVQSS